MGSPTRRNIIFQISGLFTLFTR